LTIHPAACADPLATIRAVLENGMTAGVAFNPDDSLDNLEQFLPHIDLVLVMTVKAGFGGQKFRPLYDRIIEVRGRVNATGRDIHVQVDGGITLDNAVAVINAGANVLVAGTSVFSRGSDHYAESILTLRAGHSRSSMSGSFY
jgi:ribulose-phosphate 3-epimerase